VTQVALTLAESQSKNLVGEANKNFKRNCPNGLGWLFCEAKRQRQTGRGGLIFRLLAKENVYQ